MPHTIAISFAVTFGLLLIIFIIVSGVSAGVSVVTEGVFVVVSVVIVEVSVVPLMFLSSLRQVSIRSGLLFSSTVGMLQPLSFHPFVITSAPVPPFHQFPRIQTSLDNRISAHAMSSFVVFFHADKHSARI